MTGVFHGAGTTAAAAGGLASFLLFYKMAAITAASITIAIMFPMFSLIQLNMVKFLLLTYYIISFFLYGFALSFAASL